MRGRRAGWRRPPGSREQVPRQALQLFARAVYRVGDAVRAGHPDDLVIALDTGPRPVHAAVAFRMGASGYVHLGEDDLAGLGEALDELARLLEEHA